VDGIEKWVLEIQYHPQPVFAGQLVPDSFADILRYALIVPSARTAQVPLRVVTDDVILVQWFLLDP
jgi:hypothetical protein